MFDNHVFTEFQNEIVNKFLAELTRWLLAAKIENDNLPYIEGDLFLPSVNTKIKFKITLEGKQQITPTK